MNLRWLACLAAVAACAPDEGGGSAARWVETTEVVAPEALSPELPDLARGLPLSAVTGVAASSRGLVVGGMSDDDELFWDAWVVPPDDGPPRRLAPIGNNLVAVDASGALWTDMTDLGPTGRLIYETRLSPSDGSPSVLLSPELPRGFSVERAVADGEGGWLLVGSEDVDAATRGAVFAVDARGRAARVACDQEHANSPLFLDATLARDALDLVVQYAAEGPATIVRVPLR